MNGSDYPEPPAPSMSGGGSPEPPLIDAEVVAAQTEAAPEAKAKGEPGKFKMFWITHISVVGRAADSVVRAVAMSIVIAFCFVTAKVDWVYQRTAAPVLKWIERWIPGMGELRTSMKVFAMFILLTGATIGGIVAAEAGLGFFASLGLIAYAMVYLPYLIVITPAVWLNVLINLALISAILNGAYAITDTVLEGKGMFKSFAHRMWPGMADYVKGPAEVPEAALAPAA